MELMQLRYFLEVAKEQHITHSAERLHIAQPALTQAIHRLQDDLGVPLFESKGRNIVLTEYGRHLQQSLMPIIERLDRIPEELRRMAKLDTDTIRINVLAASALVTEAIVAYKQQSDVNFSVFQSNSDVVSDVEITTRMFSQHEKAPNRIVIREKIFLAAPGGRFKDRDKISLAELKGEGFICLLGSRQFRAICDKYCHHAGFKPTVIFESDNPTAVRNVIAANMGVGFWPEFTWGRVDNRQVKLLSITDFPLSRDIIISYNESKAENPNVTGFFRFIKEFFTARKSGMSEA